MKSEVKRPETINFQDKNPASQCFLFCFLTSVKKVYLRIENYNTDI